MTPTSGMEEQSNSFMTESLNQQGEGEVFKMLEAPKLFGLKKTPVSLLQCRTRGLKGSWWIGKLTRLIRRKRWRGMFFF